MGSLARARELAAQLNAAGVRATTDPGSIVTPCVLVVPPVLANDQACAYTATWQLFALGSGVGGESTWQQLDELLDGIAGVLDVENVTPTQYANIAGDSRYPAFLITTTDTIDQE